MEKLETIRRCDFCNEFYAPYLWNFAQQTFPAGTPADFLIELLEHPEWFACADCHHAIETRNLTVLLERNKGIREGQRPYFAKMYQSLLDNLQRN
jgi:hypothetical protein